MAYWIDTTTKTLPAVNSVGGKGYNLFKLRSFDIKVPSFGVVTSKAHQYWKKNGSLPEGLLLEIQSSMRSWGETKFLAIRSSMADEDGDANSFAGILESYLYKETSEIEKYIIKCFESLNSERAIEYSKKAGLDNDVMLGAVVVQVMVNSVQSGVAFSRSPVGDSSLILVESCYGIGEGLVSGLVDVDSYHLDRFKNLVKSSISVKEKGMFYDQNSNSLKELAIEQSKKELSSLDEQKRSKLIDQILIIEKFYDHPVDIEWAFCSENECHILQTRPITQNFRELHYYVDTNLSESYPELTSPFTGSVIPRLYESVFIESAEILGASPSRLNELGIYYKKLVQYIHGHLYYHLDSYHQALSALPGGEKNIHNWHRMIGGKLDFLSFRSRIKSRTLFEDIRTFYQLIKVALRNKSYFKVFYERSKKNREAYSQRIEKASELRDVAKTIEDLISAKFNFGLTVVNDILIMMFLSLFEKTSKAQGLDSEEITNFLKTNSDVESLKPIEGLKDFLAKITDEKKFFDVFSKLVERDEFVTYQEIEVAMMESNLSTEFTSMQEYLKLYGDRAFEELKFECLTFSQSPKNFYTFLKWYSQSEAKVVYGTDTSEAPQGLLLNWIWKKLHQYIEAREGSRLERARFYNLLRNAFLKFIYLLRKEEQFKQYELNDFFSLSYDSISEYSRGDIDLAEISHRINSKKSWSATDTSFPEYLAYDGSDNPWFKDQLIEDVSSSDTLLRGEGASLYDCSGEALVLKSPQEAFAYSDLSNKILITKTTDPAWVFIMSKCKGLISEKGSLLSHTAIIGRELSLPTIVGVKNATKIFKTGQRLEMRSSKGEVEII